MLRATRRRCTTGIAALRPGRHRGARRHGRRRRRRPFRWPSCKARELWLTGTFRYANTYPAAIALAASGRVDLEAIVTGHFALDEVDAALRAGREDPASVKPIVTP